MVKAQVPEDAVTASLLFLLGRSLDAQAPEAPSSQLPKALVEAVREMLTNQDAAALAPLVLDTIQATRERLRQDPSLTISAKRYDDLRRDFVAAHGIESGKGKSLWPVGSTTILKRSGGSWSKAVAAAGIAPSAQPRASSFGRSRITAEQFQSAVVEFTAEAAQKGSTPTYQAYVQWRKQQQEEGRGAELPSGAAIRNTFGSWNAAISSNGDLSHLPG